MNKKTKGKIFGACIIVALFAGFAFHTSAVNVMHSGKQMTDEAVMKSKMPDMQMQKEPLVTIKDSDGQKNYSTPSSHKKSYKIRD